MLAIENVPVGTLLHPAPFASTWIHGEIGSVPLDVYVPAVRRSAGARAGHGNLDRRSPGFLTHRGARAMNVADGAGNKDARRRREE